ncbi:DegT/DnrJ/EryC1/StrS family aminotransferase [Hymenobacter endophyticus]|uniref:DegT/DnrJ/EryC1/StrS family aminotransferase n=1 Tax=Hymenobacter endophyticus TaxID=3076335 RepID=A0ABU3TG80_9BACT|nr:DegT/DnrJ/EryC1/StrS family aminotransferase [Hymenobacter endophyticus]MDU0370362.1 DegT/DnrJ/EryC1/StrS family aminotransferase [Hymenobacter endophyticus]
MGINVTKSYLPPMEEYVGYLAGIWERAHLTNAGPLVVELEKSLKEYLGVKHLFFVNNGTIALQIALKALDLKGEILTTPFSYVATTSSIVWEGSVPVFVDIDPQTLCIDPNLLEAAITPQTVAIMATHVYGNPCNVEAIAEVAQRHGLRVIYDAAHAFGVTYKDNSVLNYGDISTLSFHATKLFHTVEGGAIVTDNDELAHKISYMRNFGHNGPEAFWGVGVNGKSSEFHAAMGLCVLPRVDELIRRRRELSERYDALLAGTGVRRPQLQEHTTRYNYSYYPTVMPSEQALLAVRDALNAADIIPRRYFYPSLNTLEYTGQQSAPVSEDISTRALCLPLYYELLDEEVDTICRVIKSVMEAQPAVASAQQLSLG